MLLAKKWHATFLQDRPGPVDRVVVVPPCEGVSKEPGTRDTPQTLHNLEYSTELEQFFDAMVQEGFDLAIQVHGGGRYSNPFVLRLGAGMTVGLKTPDAVPLDRWVSYIYFQP